MRDLWSTLMCAVLTYTLKILLQAVLCEKWQSIIPSHGICDNNINHNELHWYLYGSNDFFLQQFFPALQGLFLFHAGQ